MSKGIRNQFELSKYILEHLTQDNINKTKASRHTAIKLLPSEKLVLLCIVDFMNDKTGWYSYPSITRLTERAVMSRSGCITALNSLVELEVIVRDSGFGFKDSKRPNHYNINMTALSALTGEQAHLVGNTTDVTKLRPPKQAKQEPSSKPPKHEPPKQELDDDDGLPDLPSWVTTPSHEPNQYKSSSNMSLAEELELDNAPF